MKLLLPAFLFFSFPTFAQYIQEDLVDYTIVVNPKTYGYVKGIRLDSIDAVYGEFSRYGGEGLYFDYGQKWDKRKEMVITDKEGKRLVFGPYTNPLFLNFFYFNGWQLDKALSVSEGSVGSFILKKKQ
jgi:hypothetical protein